MLKKIAQKTLLLECAHELRRKNFRPGFDGMTAQHTIMWLDINGDQLCRKLQRDAYDPMPATTFKTAKPDGTYRQLAKLSALDMVVQNAILHELLPFFEAHFSDFSHAYRSGKGISTAIQHFCAFGTQYPFAARIDPKACFDNIDHIILENQLMQFLSEPQLVSLIMKFVRMPIISDGEANIPEKGILQGAPLSNLLCNVYLTGLDEYLQGNSIPFVRYADDIVIFSSTHASIRAHYEQALDFLQNQLSLTPNAKKCKIDAPVNLCYLGHRFENSHYGLTAFDVGISDVNAYRQWHTSKPANNHRRIDILRDGILRQKDFSVAFDGGDGQSTFPVSATDTINIYSSVIFDTNFLQKVLSSGITISIFDKNDTLIGRFIPNSTCHTPIVPHRQLLEYYDEKKRLNLAKSFVLASIHNCRLNIRYYNKQKSNSHYSNVLDKINALEKDIKNCKAYDSLLLLEARVREYYYSCFDFFIEKSIYCFHSRSRRPPLNEVNAMLSFGNVILYNLIATEINKSSLDVQIGYLHATNRRPESLNLDIAETYKPLLVDRTIFSLINLNMLNEDDFYKTDREAVYLTQNGKRKYLRAFYEKLDNTLTIHGEKLTYTQIIRQDIQALTRYFRHDERYVPFKQVK